MSVPGSCFIKVTLNSMGGLLKNIYSQDRSLIIQALKKKQPQAKITRAMLFNSF